MQRFVFFMFVTVTIIVFFAKGDFYGRFKILPGSTQLLAELTGALALLYVVAEGVRGRFKFIRPAYWLVLMGLGITIICGVLINGVESGPLFAGLRGYIRAIPWFFLPAIFAFSQQQIRTQLRWLLVISFLQIPISIEQKIQASRAGFGATGDTTIGTLGDSGVLSIYLICAVCITTALYARKELKLGQFIVLFLLLLVPTTINETKVTVVLLPLGFIASYMTASEPELRAKRLVAALGFLVLFGAIFVPVYNILMAQHEHGTSIQDFFADEEQVDRYVSEKKEIGSQGTARRGDAIRVPLEYLAKHPIRLVFGYGIGNVSDSSFGTGFSGAYLSMWKIFLVTSFTRFILELGLLGIFLILMMHWLIFQDCIALARKKGFYGALAAGWTGAVIVMTISMFYTQTHIFPVLSFLFWYFSGLISAERMREALKVSETNLSASSFSGYDRNKRSTV